MSDTLRRFPIQNGPTVPWEVMAPHDRQCQKNHGGQTLERIAQRGGLLAAEAWCVVNDMDCPWEWRCTKDDFERLDRQWHEFAAAINERYSIRAQCTSELESQLKELKQERDSMMEDARVMVSALCGMNPFSLQSKDDKDKALSTPLARRILDDDKGKQGGGV